MKSLMTSALLTLPFFLPLTVGAEQLPAEINTEQQLNIPTDNRCNISASDQHIDYGIQSRGQLQTLTGGNASVLSPGKRSVMINIVCPFTQKMVLSIHGDRAASGDLRYGDRGSVKLRLNDVTVDGQAVQVAESLSSGVISGTSASELWLQPGKYVSVVQNGRVLKGKNLSAMVEIEPTLPEEETRVSQQLITQTNLTIELVE